MTPFNWPEAFSLSVLICCVTFLFFAKIVKG
jgi:hypothetical protein